jgi:glutathione S-transferase
MTTIKLYRHPLSGHCHRVELLLSILALDAQIINVDLMDGEHKRPEFLQKNSFGQVPVLEDGAATLADSNAILTYLASRYDQNRNWLPEDPINAAEVHRFLSIASGSVAYGPAVARLINVFGANLDHDRAKEIAHYILGKMDEHLQGRQWLATDLPTIADLSNYAYIAHAPEGNVSLQAYTEVKAWLQRIEGLPGFIPMQATAVGLAA